MRTNVTCIISLVLALAWTSIAPAQQRRTVAENRTKPEELGLTVKNVKEYVYKKTEQGELKIFVHFPEDWQESDKRPAIVFFFGGGWKGGTVEQFTTQATYLATRGMVAARADYRVTSRHNVTPDKCVEDAKSAVRWIRKNAEMLGVDPDRIAASGGSAGGHMAACTGTTPGPESDGEDLSISSRPNAMVLFNPAFLQLQFMSRRLDNNDELARQIMPVRYLDKHTPPAILFYGSKDTLIRGGREFVEKSKELGNRAELYVTEGEGHGYFNFQPWTVKTLYQTDEFFASLGYVQGKPTLDVGRISDASENDKSSNRPARQPEKKDGLKTRPTRRGPSFQQITRRFDANKDGKVTLEEFGERRQMLKRFDHNGDGVITADDFKGQPAARGSTDKPSTKVTRKV